MYRRLLDFYHHHFIAFFEGIINLFIFFPYFFSVKKLTHTLFAPWKNTIPTFNKQDGSLKVWFDTLSFEIISRCIGFTMRISLLLFYLLLQATLIILLPFIIVLYFFAVPLFFVLYEFSETTEEKKQRLKQKFLYYHLHDEQNRIIVEQWFEAEYQKHLRQEQWWKLSNLLSLPPLARDWTEGFTPNLDQYSEDLTSPIYQGSMKHIVGRAQEIDQLERALLKEEGACALIVGEEGVGKHSIIDAFAKRIYEGQANTLLVYKRILKINMETVLAQYTDLHQREQFIETLFQEAIAAKNIIICIEKIDRYVSTEHNRVDLSVTLEKYAKHAHVHIIGITTPYDYQKYIHPQDGLSQVFSTIQIAEVSKEDAEIIILERIEMFEQRHGLYMPYETVHAAIEKSNFYITTIPFPEKAMHILENACIYTKKKTQDTVVRPEFIDIVLSEETHVATSLTDALKHKLVQLESILKNTIIGQDTALEHVASTMRRSFLLQEKRKKPLASLLFLGPTGVGKTATAQAIADTFFGSNKYLIRFDMSLYQTVQDIGTLIGSTTTNEPGLFVSAIREQPFGVLLLDEIEKASHDVINIFLSLLDEGYITDGFGKKVDCKNLVVIATSNAGADACLNGPPGTSIIDCLVEHALFSPEFLNRFDGVIEFTSLSTPAITDIALKKIDTIKKDILGLYKVTVQISEPTLQNILQNRYNPKYGVREMDRVLKTQIEDIVAKKILENNAKEGDIITI